MKKLLIITFFVTVVAGIFSFKAFNRHAEPGHNQTVSAQVGILTGANDIQLIFDRTGPDAGQGDINFDVDVWCNSETNIYSYNVNIPDGYTHWSTHVQGPNPTAVADIAVQPYNLTWY